MSIRARIRAQQSALAVISINCANDACQHVPKLQVIALNMSI